MSLKTIRIIMTIKTKIIATIGPSSNTRSKLKNMIASGMNMARLNFSHGSYNEHEKAILMIRALSKELDKPVGILLDLQGPKIRTGKLKGGHPVELKKGKTVKITSRAVLGTTDMVSTTYQKLVNDVKKGASILLMTV
jgi:pyruvate kinase